MIQETNNISLESPYVVFFITLQRSLSLTTKLEAVSFLNFSSGNHMIQETNNISLESPYVIFLVTCQCSASLIKAAGGGYEAYWAHTTQPPAHAMCHTVSFLFFIFNSGIPMIIERNNMSLDSQ